MDMLARALDAGVPARWVTGDAVYGQYYKLRKALEDRGVFYVLAVPMNQRVIAKTTASIPGGEWRTDELITALPALAWRTRSAGQGSKGDRQYAWARAQINGERDPDAEYWLLARRSLTDKADIAYYLTHGPKRVSLAELAQAAGSRWAIEESLQTSKGQTGLDHYQVRQYTGWYRHVTLSMLAHSFLTVTRSKKGGLHPRDSDLIALSLPEIRHLLVCLIFAQPPNPEHILSRSRWRRRHQQTAKRHHYRTRGHSP